MSHVVQKHNQHRYMLSASPEYGPPLEKDITLATSSIKFGTVQKIWFSSSFRRNSFRCSITIDRAHPGTPSESRTVPLEENENVGYSSCVSKEISYLRQLRQLDEYPAACGQKCRKTLFNHTLQKRRFKCLCQQRHRGTELRVRFIGAKRCEVQQSRSRK